MHMLTQALSPMMLKFVYLLIDLYNKQRWLHLQWYLLVIK